MIYALYKGDKFIDLGTIQYLAKKMNVQIKTIQFYLTDAYKKRSKDDYSNRYILIKIEDDENGKRDK